MPETTATSKIKLRAAMDRKAAANIKLGLLEEEQGEWKSALLELLHELE